MARSPDPPPGAGLPDGLVDLARLSATSRLDTTTRLFAALLDVPGSRITVRVDHDQSVSSWGQAAQDTPLPSAVLDEGASVISGGYLGAPLKSRTDAVLGAVEAFAHPAKQWTRRELDVVEAFCLALSDHLDVILELETRIAHLDLGFDAAAIGTWDWDLESDSLRWDARLHAVLHTTPQDITDIATHNKLIHPDDRERVVEALETAVATGGDFAETYRLSCPDGAQRWVESRGRAVIDRAGRPLRMLGVAYDVSEPRAGAQRLTRVLDSLGSGFLTIALDGAISYANGAAQRLLARSRDELIGADPAKLLPSAISDELRELGSSAMMDHLGEPFRFEAQVDQPDDAGGGEQWLDVSVHASPDGLAVALADITEQRRLAELQTASLEAREQAIIAVTERQAAQTRFERLAHAGEALAPALDQATALEVSLDLVVPSVADCALIHLGDPGDPRSMLLAAVRHPDPAAVEALTRVFASFQMRSSTVDIGAAPVRMSRRVTLDPALVEQLAKTPQDRHDIEATHITSAIIVPLLARGRTLGTIALGALDARQIDSADLTLIEQLATRMAVTIDNARLFEDARAARATAESASATLALLGEVSQALSSTFDVRVAVGRLARLVVPALADCSMVTLVDEDGALEDIGRWHRDPQMLPLINAYADIRSRASTMNAPVRRVVRTGEAVIIPNVDEGVLLQALSTTAARDIARQLNIGSSVELPLLARGRTLGAITLLSEQSRGAHTAEQLAAAREVASRAAVALDNAQTFARQRRVAEELQHSMLTRPPEPDHIQIAVRYLPAAPTVQVGGDWYDAFLDRDGNTVLVIGDVMGHDIAAAAAMGQIRSLVRGIGFDRHESPSQILARVDAAMAGLAVGALATALVARIEQSPTEAEAGTRRITWCSAGHPAPMLVSADGAVEDLVTPAGMLLGVDPSAQRLDRQAPLPVGSTVVLFTDGLFERRTISLDDGLDLVRSALGDLAGEQLGPLCDGLLERMLPDDPEDDVALVAVRLFDQNAPRPAQAGPRKVPRPFLGADSARTDTAAPPPVFADVERVEVPPDDLAPGRCRRFLNERLALAFTDRPLNDSIRFDLDLVATELVTNALRVASGGIAMSIECHAGQSPWVRLAVTDDGPGTPELSRAALTDTHGRGLGIIATLSREWGFERSGDTKTVWARLAV